MQPLPPPRRGKGERPKISMVSHVWRDVAIYRPCFYRRQTLAKQTRSPVTTRGPKSSGNGERRTHGALLDAQAKISRSAPRPQSAADEVWQGSTTRRETPGLREDEKSFFLPSYMLLRNFRLSAPRSRPAWVDLLTSRSGGESHSGWALLGVAGWFVGFANEAWGAGEMLLPVW